MDLTGDGIKEASKMFQQAAWCFDYLKTLVTNLNPSEISVDFTAESLGMLSNLMLAQAQYLFYKKALDANMKPPVLAKISMQVSEYFRKAYELSQTNQSLKAFDGSKFANVMQYHSIYFKAMAWWVISQDEYRKVGEEARGMGLAVALLKATCFMMEKAKAVVLTIGSNYQDNFHNKFNEIIQMRDKAIKDNSSIYFERETPIDQLPKPDC
jgi:programmed cell death 6-interacting protein